MRGATLSIGRILYHNFSYCVIILASEYKKRNHMAKLNFKKDNSKFELEVEDEVYTGILHDLTKRQLAAQNKILAPIRKEDAAIGKLFNKVERLQVKLNTKTKLKEWPAVDKLEDDIFTKQDEIKTRTDKLKKATKLEPLFKKRIEDTVESDNLKQILSAGAEYGYENVFNTILQDIDEKNRKKQ